MATEEERVLGISEAAKMLAVSVSTLRRWAETGEIQTIRLPSGHRRFLAGEVQRKRVELGFPVTGEASE